MSHTFYFLSSFPRLPGEQMRPKARRAGPWSEDVQAFGSSEPGMCLSLPSYEGQGTREDLGVYKQGPSPAKRLPYPNPFSSLNLLYLLLWDSAGAVPV